ncbi:MAG: hypothetical protein EOO65_06155, partial [Methanosarcinales archaeon]
MSSFRFPTPLTIVFTHRTYSFAGRTPVALPQAAMENPALYTYPLATAPTVRAVATGLQAVSTRSSGSAAAGSSALPAAASTAAVVALPRPVGIGSRAGLHGIGSSNSWYDSFSSAAFFLSKLTHATFGTPQLLRLHAGSVTCAQLYAQVAAASQRFIRRRLPLAPATSWSPPPDSDSVELSIAKVWGFTLKRVSSVDPTTCSKCHWFNGCTGCIVRPLNKALLAELKLGEGEMLAVEWDPVLLDEVCTRPPQPACTFAAQGAATAAHAMVLPLNMTLWRLHR